MSEPIFTPERIAAAHEQVERLQHELDITNADNIALWLSANMDDSPLGWLACRIIEAHETAITAARRDALEMAAEVLEEHAEAGDRACLFAIEGSRLERDLAAGVVTLRRAIAAIRLIDQDTAGEG